MNEPPATEKPHRQMWITPGRVFYRGLLGEPTTRRLGGHVLYVGQGGSVSVSVDDRPWRTGPACSVAPYQLHRVVSQTPHVIVVILEPETLAPGALPALFQTPCFSPGEHAQALLKLQQAGERLRDPKVARVSTNAWFDEQFFGAALALRALDPRIAQVLRLLGQPQLQSPADAAGLAAAVGLSASRFVHLFKQEVGVPFRALRTWKRARDLLRHVTSGANLAELAQQMGYADSTHFSHAIRQTFGLQPKAVMAGSRRLVLVDEDLPPGW